jgi:hypothetical protein
LVIDDCEVAAAQFLESRQSTIFKRLLFYASDAPEDERIIITSSALQSARFWPPIDPREDARHLR